jgi:uncharacterized membrane protein (DUF106 family)
MQLWSKSRANILQTLLPFDQFSEPYIVIVVVVIIIIIIIVVLQ